MFNIEILNIYQKNFFSYFYNYLIITLLACKKVLNSS